MMQEKITYRLIAEKYQVDQPLGQGGWASVYEVTHLTLHTKLAMKVLAQHLAENDSARERFLREAKTVCQLEHPGIIRVYDFGVLPDDRPYYIMDLVDSKSLEDLLKEQGPIPYDRALRIFLQICDGLEAAHGKGIIHRDIKPSNIAVTADDRAIILDFGLAKDIFAEGHGLTQTGETFGTPYYMSPEQYQGGKLDARTDIYSLGCLMYECLTGNKPFDADSAVVLMEKHLTAEPPPFARTRAGAGVPLAIQEIVLAAIEKVPDERQSSVTELARQLRAVQAHPNTPHQLLRAILHKAERSCRKWRRSPKSVIVPAMSVAALVIGSLVFYAFSNRPAPPPEYQFNAQAMSTAHRTPLEAVYDLKSVTGSFDHVRLAQLLDDSAPYFTSVSTTSIQDVVARANGLEQLSRHKEAAAVAQQGIALCREAGDSAAGDLERLQETLALAEAGMGNYARATEIAQQVVDSSKAKVGENAPRFGEALSVLASVYSRSKSAGEAVPLLRKRLQILSVSSLDSSPEVADCKIELAKSLADVGQLVEARRLLSQVLQVRSALSTETNGIDVLSRAGQVYELLGDEREASNCYQMAIKDASSGGSISSSFSDMLPRYARLLRKQGHDAAASSMEQQSAAINRTLKRQPGEI